MQSISEFLATLNEVGFEISPAETIEIHKLMTLAENAGELRLGIRMLLVNSKQEQDLFDFIWDLYDPHSRQKNDQQPPISDVEGMDMADLPIQPPEGGSTEYCPNPAPISAGAVGSNDPSVALIRFSSDLKGPTKQMIQGNYRNAAAIFLRYLLQDQATLQEIGFKRHQAMDEIKEMLDAVVPDHADDLIERLDAKIDELLKERLREDRFVGQDNLKVQKIEELPIYSLQQSPELHQALKKLGNKLASKHKRKLKAGRKKINLRKTIRANIQHGGVLLELKHQNPRLDRPKLTIITDVSSSTIKATRMFLSIIWQAKEVFSDIHFYEFIANMIDVTAELKRSKSIDEAIKAALDCWDRQEVGKQNSDYYMAFRKFEKLRGKNLSSKDTIIVLGDLRDWLGPWKNNKPMSATVMGNLAKKVKRFIVLNPEASSQWNTGDSIVRYVEKREIEVYEATTLEKLIDVLLDL